MFAGRRAIIKMADIVKPLIGANFGFHNFFIQTLSDRIRLHCGDLITLPELRRMTTAALFIVLTSGAWLIGVAFLMAFKPRRFLDLLSLTAANWRINVIEQGLRLVAGLALIARGEASKLPTLFHLGGWFIVASSIVLLVIPLRLHAGYAI